MARDGPTEATASGGASMVTETEKKKNTTMTVLGLYRATNMTSRRHAARHEHTKIGACSQRRAWKRFEARQRRAGGGALSLARF
jgi:hypothetical protein